MQNRHWSSRLVALAFMLFGPVLTYAAQPGIWQTHRLEFNYLAAEPIYSCEGLQQKLEDLLRASGARLDGRVDPSPCVGGPGVPAKMLSATLKFSTLQPAGAAGRTAASGSTMAGDWHEVKLVPRGRGNKFDGGDCELVQEFKDKVLPAFATRNLKSNLPCVPFQSIGYFFSLSFDVFAARDAAAAAH